MTDAMMQQDLLKLIRAEKWYPTYMLANAMSRIYNGRIPRQYVYRELLKMEKAGLIARHKCSVSNCIRWCEPTKVDL